MPAVPVIRVGQANGVGATDALFLKVWSGEVLAQFLRKTVTEGRHFTRTISQGSSASFPVTGRMTAAYHTPGDDLLDVGNQPRQGERVITIDDLLAAPLLIPVIDEARAHYDYRSIYTKEAGSALANRLDDNVLRVGVLAARASGVHTQDQAAPSPVIAATALTNGAALSDAIFDAGVRLDELDTPAEGRTAFMRPAQYALLVKAADRAMNMDFNGGQANGAYSEGTVYRINGIELVKSNNFPRTNLTGSPGAKYDVNATNTACLVMQPGAVGTVQLIGLKTEMRYMENRVATFVNSMLAVGHGILRPSSACEIRTS